MLRLGPGVVLMLCVVGELSIYCGIAYHLWKHDKRSLNNKTITVTMRKERNQKNVITLGGQAFAFFVEIITSGYILFHMKYTNLTDPSTMSVMILVSNSLVSISQFLSSHELKRYLRTEWNIHIPFGPWSSIYHNQFNCFKKENASFFWNWWFDLTCKGHQLKVIHEICMFEVVKYLILNSRFSS